MPVAREVRHLYRTPSWLALVEYLKKRSGNRCEWCGKPNGREVWTRSGLVLLPAFGRVRVPRMFWRPSGHDITWRDHEAAIIPPSDPDWEIALRFRVRLITAVCCGAHLNHVAGDDRRENAAYLCQWCHLHQDLLHHRETRCRRKDAARPLLAELEALGVFTTAVQKFAEGE